MKIMIVEDHGGMREMLRSLLLTPGCEISECTDGSEALAAYRRVRPDWVLMDIAMQKMNGISATRQITRAFPEARVLVVTDYASPRMRKAAEEAGACGFVPKDRLLEVRTVINGLPFEPPPSVMH